MIYELRTYTCMPGKKMAVLQRMKDVTLPIFRKLGIRNGPIYTSLIGQNNLEVKYMIEWSSLAERDHLWTAFMADPEWQKAVTEGERDGPIVEKISNEVLAPVPFSIP